MRYATKKTPQKTKEVITALYTCNYSSCLSTLPLLGKGEERTPLRGLRGEQTG